MVDNEKEFEEAVSENEIEEDDDIVELKTDSGAELKCRIVGSVAHKAKLYALLQPLEPTPGMQEGTAFLFEWTRNEDGDDLFIPVNDPSTVDAVFKEYKKWFASEDK